MLINLLKTRVYESSNQKIKIFGKFAGKSFQGPDLHSHYRLNPLLTPQLKLDFFRHPIYQKTNSLPATVGTKAAHQKLREFLGNFGDVC